MRSLTAIFLLSWVALAQTTYKPEDLCTIEGKVIHELTGAPISRAIVAVVPVQTDRNAPQTRASAASTDAEGHFVVTDLPPGPYRIAAQKAGFATSDFGVAEPRTGGGGPILAASIGPPVILQARQKKSGVDFKLRPYGAISGRVLDTDGEPMWHAQVGVYRWTYSTTGARTLQRAQDGDTDETGGYRLSSLAPGRYAVCAYGPGQPDGRDRSAKTVSESYATTCYPGSDMVEGASAILVQAGKTAEGIDFKMIKRPAATVSGRLSNGPPGINRGSVRLYSVSNSIIGTRYPGIGSKGEFEINGVPAGRYRLVALVGDQTAEEDVEVGERPVDATLTLGGGAEVAGTLKVDGDVKLEPPLTIYVYDPVIGISWGATRLTDPGSFQLNQVYRWNLQLRFNVPPGFYVKSARMGSRDVLVDGLDLRGGGGEPLEIVMGAGVGTIRGSVRNDKDEPVTQATVLVAPKEISRQKRVDEYRTFRTNDAGIFTASNLPPGDYTVYAWTQVDDRAWLNEEFMHKVGGRSVNVSVDVKGSYTVELKAIPPEVQR